MKKLRLLGIVGAVVLLVGPMLVAWAEEGAGPRAERGERRGPPAGAAERGRGERPPEVVLTPAQEEALKPKIQALEDAVKQLREAAIKELGEQNGRAFVFQAIRRAMMAGMPEGGPRPERRGPPREGDRAPER